MGNASVEIASGSVRRTIGLPDAGNPRKSQWCGIGDGKRSIKQTEASRAIHTQRAYSIVAALIDGSRRIPLLRRAIRDGWNRRFIEYDTHMMASVKSLVRQLFYRSALFQGLVGLCSIALGRTKGIGMSHLSSYRENDAIGPLQRDEAVAMFGIIRTLRPKLVVEFGFFHGHSAFNFLQAMPVDGQLYSYDIDADSIKRATTEFKFDQRFTFIGKSQADFAPQDINNQKIDFAFFDAAHDLDLNILTFNRIVPHLAAEAMVAIHDTGLWHRDHFAAIHETFTLEHPGVWKDEDLYAHQPGERAFIDWILAEYPDFSAIHFHSTRTLRHGFTLLQRQRALS